MQRRNFFTSAAAGLAGLVTGRKVQAEPKIEVTELPSGWTRTVIEGGMETTETFELLGGQIGVLSRYTKPAK